MLLLLLIAHLYRCSQRLAAASRGLLSMTQGTMSRRARRWWKPRHDATRRERARYFETIDTAPVAT
jgi:hypothetical protein